MRVSREGKTASFSEHTVLSGSSRPGEHIKKSMHIRYALIRRTMNYPD
jgi:hypothetical protein